MVKRQGHQGAWLTAAFTHQAAAAVRVETYWLGEPTATSPSAGAAVDSAMRGASAPTEGGEGRGHIGRPPAYSFLCTELDAKFINRGTQYQIWEARSRPLKWEASWSFSEALDGQRGMLCGRASDCNREFAGSNLGRGYFALRSTQPSITPWLVNEYQLRLGTQRQAWLIPIADEMQVV